MSIDNVGDLIDALSRHDRKTPLRVLFRPGELEAIDSVRMFSGRAAIVPAPIFHSRRPESTRYEAS